MTTKKSTKPKNLTTCPRWVDFLNDSPHRGGPSSLRLVAGNVISLDFDEETGLIPSKVLLVF